MPSDFKKTKTQLIEELNAVRQELEKDDTHKKLVLIQTIETGLSQRLTLQEICDLVGGKLQEYFDATTILIADYDHITNMVQYPYIMERGVSKDNSPLPLGNSFSDHVIKTKKPLLLTQSAEILKLGKKLGRRKIGEDTKSIIAVPLLSNKQAIGMISLQNYDAEGAFDRGDLQLLETLAGSMSVALENARLFDETQQRNAELAIIESVQQGLAAQVDMQTIIDLVGDKLGEIFKTDVVQINIFDSVINQLHIPYCLEKGERHTHESRTPWGFRKHVIETGEPLIINEDMESVSQQFDNPVLAGEAPISSAFVPLSTGDQVSGIISLQNMERENAFPTATVGLLTTIASSMSVALKNARLFEETTQRNAELAIINSIQHALVAELDLQGIYDAVGDKVREIFDTQVIIIGSFDTQAEKGIFHYFFEKGEKYFPDPVPYTELMKYLLEKGETVVINENLVKEGKMYGLITPAGESPKSAVWVPYKVGNQVRGTILLQNIDREHAFSDSDVRLLETLANSMSIALENARLFDETTQRNAELAIINSVGEAMSQKLDVDTVIKIVGDKVQQIFNADMVGIALINDQEGYFEIPYSYALGEYFEEKPIPKGKGLIGKISETRQPLLLHSAEELAEAGMVTTQADKGSEKFIQSWLGVPIIVGDKFIGGVAVQSYKMYAFKESDRSLLATLAANMGVAIENARLFDETNRLLEESQQHANELSTINTVSRAMASELELDALIWIIGERMQKIFNADIAYLGLVNVQKNMIEFPYAFGDSSIMPIKLGQGLTSQILESGEPLLINRDDAWRQTEEKVERIGILSKSYLGVPILVGKNAIGVLSVQSTKSSGRFDEKDMGLLNTIAANVGVALENARLFDELQRSNRETSRALERQTATSDILHIIANSPGEIQPVLEAVAKHAAKLCEADDVQIYRVEQDRLVQVAHFGPLPALKDGESLPLVEGLVAGRAVLERRTIHLDAGELSEDDYPESVKLFRRFMHRFMIVTPLVREGAAIGAIVVRRNEVRPFSDSQINLLSTFSDQAAIAIENVRLFNEVERQKEYLEALISSSPVAIVTIGLDGNVTGWSPASESLFGYSEEEAIGKQIEDLVANHPDVREEAKDYTSQIPGQATRVHITGKRTHKDGHLIDVDIHALPVKFEGKQIGYIALYNDITELERARREAEKANQAKSSFLANMSHELRTPLNAIVGFTRIVKRKGEGVLPGKQVDNLDKVLVSSEHLLGLINTILDISKIEAGKMEVQLANFALGPLVDMLMTTTQPLVRQDTVRLETVVPDNLPPIYSDQDKVKQILINMLSNAAKFTLEGQIIVSVEQVEDRFDIKVTDTGAGIASDALEHIFEEFQQADTSTTREYGGTGLGLSISRSLARLMGGDLTVSSEVGKGSTFILTLPVRYRKIASLSTTQAIEDKPVTSADARIVLVIDDNLDAINLMRQNLEEAGYQVITATSGDEGVAKAKKYQPFAITLDIMMPKKDGWQVMHDLKADPDTRGIPVVMVTIVDNKTLGFRLGAADYLVKPLDEDQVLASLERLENSNGGDKLKCLLVVDDDSNVIDMVEQLLDDSGYNIMVASDGKDALEKIAKDPPDVILLDLMMPKLDGFGVIDCLRADERLRQIPVIVLTVKSLSKEEQENLFKSAVKIIQKQGLSDKQLLSEISLAMTKKIKEESKL